MDLRKEIHEIIKETGHYVLLQRTSRKLRCACWNEKYKEADSYCPICLGEGWVSRIERHKCRRQNATNIISLPGKIQQTPIGRLATDTKTFFFEHHVSPKRGDMIMEVGWKGNQPTHMITAYEISNAEDMRGDRGRIEFYQVSVKEKSADTNVRGITVRSIGPIKNYEILK